MRSIQRKFALVSGNDALAPGTINETLAPRAAISQISVGREEHRQLRKATPANTPLRRTLKWAASLPPDVLPTVLLRRYARVANLMAATWENPKIFRAYMGSLLSDKRGNRRGFPPDVVSELVALQRYHNKRDRNPALGAMSKNK
jgi:hypothetical protein